MVIIIFSDIHSGTLPGPGEGCAVHTTHWKRVIDRQPHLNQNFQNFALDQMNWRRVKTLSTILVYHNLFGL